MIEQGIQPTADLKTEAPVQPGQTNSNKLPHALLLENEHEVVTAPEEKAEQLNGTVLDVRAIYERVEYMERSAGATKLVFPAEG